MRYIDSYKLLFSSQGWFLNLLMCAIAPMVPIVGPMVVIGYLFEILEALHRHGDSTYPDFDFNKLGQYLMRGLWPFLVSFVVNVPFSMLFFVFYIIFWIVISLIASSTSGVVATILVLIFVLFALTVFIALALAVTLVTLPMMLRAGLMQNFGAAFSFAFIRDFIGRMWKTMLLSQLFLMVSAMVVLPLGMMLCGIGYLPAIVLVMFAHIHIMYQLYEEYLRRGGEKISLPIAQAPSRDRGDYDDRDDERSEGDPGIKRRPRRTDEYED